MRKLYKGISVFVVLFLALFLYASLTTISIGPCEGFASVGSYATPVKSAEDARQIALDYYSGLGYRVDLDDFRIFEDGENKWIVAPGLVDYVRKTCENDENMSACYQRAYCHEGNQKACISDQMILENSVFGNSIKVRYIIPC